MNLEIEKIKALLTDSHLKQQFCNQLETILVIDFNYEHITQLEQYVKVLKSGLGEYYKQYHPNQEFLTIQAGIIAENTRVNHYKKDDEKLQDVHSLFEELIGRKHTIKDFKALYYISLL